MGLAYGSKLEYFPNLEAAGRHAVDTAYYSSGSRAVGFLFRVEGVSYSMLTGDGDRYGSTGPSLELFAFPVRRFTPCGATLLDVWSGARERFVDLRPNAKQWASRTPEEAVRQLLERRRRQDWILSRKLDRCREEMLMCKIFLKKGGCNL